MPRQAGKSSQKLTWRQFVKFTYPDILRRTYCVPPLHFNRVPYDRVFVPGIPTSLPVLVPQAPISALPGTTGPPAAPQPSPQTTVPSSAQQQTAEPSTAEPVSTAATSSQADTTTVSPSSEGCSTSSQTVPSACQPPQTSNCTQSPHTEPCPGDLPSPQPADTPLSAYSLWPTDTHPAATPTPVYLSDTTDDFSQQYLLYNLHALAKHLGEAMFILSSVNFKNYLAEPSVGKQFPRPRQVQKHIQGDFDFLVIHRLRGVLVGEMKSVGRFRTELTLSQADDDSNVVKRVEKGVKQLEKGKKVVCHLVSDVVKGLPVRAALFLPFVSRSQLSRVLTAHPALAQSVCFCLDVNTLPQAVDMVLCSDDLSDPNAHWDVTSHVLSQLSSWWQRRMTSFPGQVLSDDQYMDITGRFVGPATTVSVHCNARPRVTVEVRTEGEALAELGMRLSRLVLTPEQIDLLNRAPPRAFLTGPPGTGKSVMLILMALVWLHKGWDVQVVSLADTSLAACRLVYHQIRKTLASASDSGVPGTAGRVSFRSFELFDKAYQQDVLVETADVLTKAVQDQPLCVIMDEASHDPRAQEFVRKLHKADPNLHLWAADIRKHIPFEELQMERMTRPLRSAPCVVRHIQRAVISRTYCDQVEPYCTEGIPSPADGLSPTVIYHLDPPHTSEDDAISCYQCGVDVANALHQLGVGKTGRLVPNSPDPLQFRDVLVLEVNTTKAVNDDLTDPEGTVLLPASALVRGLRAEGVPVSVIENRHHVEEAEDRIYYEDKWKRHHLNGCTVPKEEVSDEAESMCCLFEAEEEEVEWHEMSSATRLSWKLHFEEGCELEGPEVEERWKAHRQKARKAWKTRVEDMVTARHDVVVVTRDLYVQGLERKVVVALMRANAYHTATDRMSCISRCTTHLVIVHSGDSTHDPTDTSGNSDDDGENDIF